MYIGYLRGQQVFDKTDPKSKILKELYDNSFKKIKLPYTLDNLTINEIFICSASQGCNYKKDTYNGKITKTKFVLIRDSNTHIVHDSYINDSSKYVLIMINGSLNYKGNISNVHIRIPNSLNIGYSLGMSYHTINIQDPEKSQILVNNVLKSCTKSFAKMANLEQQYNNKIVTITTQGGHVFKNMTDNRLEYKIANFIPVMETINKYVNTHEMKHEPGNKKQFPKVSFKSEDSNHCTLTISNFGYVDTKGANNMYSVMKTFNVFKRAITSNKIYDKIVFDKNAKATNLPKQTKLTGCPKGNPEYNGSCPDGYIPKVNKNNKLCCYKGKYTKSTMQKLHNNMINKGINIPNTLKNILNKYKINASIKISAFPYLNGTKVVYKSKSQNCDKYKKEELKEIAKILQSGFVLKGKKEELCVDIIKKLKERNK